MIIEKNDDIFAEILSAMEKITRFFLLILMMGLNALHAQERMPGFSQQEIPESVFVRMRGKSFKAECSTPRSDLRYLRVLHYNKEGKVLEGELVCHKLIAEDLLYIFRKLYEAKYPIERMVLVDEYDADDEASMRANNTSSFNFRRVAGGRTLSLHSRGMAIDINPRYNPYVRWRKGKRLVSPVNGTAYADRSKDFPYKIVKGDLCYRLFKERGFTWGGDWKNSIDYQQFEKR